jgi:hypothetical protein
MLGGIDLLGKVFNISFNFSGDLKCPGVRTGTLCLKQTFAIEKKGE